MTIDNPVRGRNCGSKASGDAAILMMDLRGSWACLGQVLDNHGIVYNDNIFKDEARAISEYIIFRHFHPSEPGVRFTRNTELVEMELFPNAKKPKEKETKSARDKVRRVTKSLHDALLIVRVKEGREVMFEPGRFLLEHYENNIVNGVLMPYISE